MSSETAYSKVKGQLDHSTKKQEALQRERKHSLMKDTYVIVIMFHTFSAWLSVKCNSAQVQALKKEVEQTNRLLNQLRIQKTTAEEVYTKMSYYLFLLHVIYMYDSNIAVVQCF